MPVKIRLQRHGKKGKPFYWIVAADARAKRDGRFLEKLGTYNPNTNPAVINLDIDGTVKWLEDGAQPTDTARAILSYKGVLYKKHLLGGVAKGAFSEEDAEKKFEAWMTEKNEKINAKVKDLAKAKSDKEAKIFEAEKTINEDRILAAKSAANEAVRAEADAKAAKEAAANAATEVEEVKPETIDDAAAAAAEEGDKA
ncbi:MAG TPA: 30S ribosomal protein S16 [Lutibacter sp.]|nr:30S ribosomal protein S16 [Lutibacter sp.]